jgi:hypothetical protein
MNEIKEQLVLHARNKYLKIYPCGKGKKLEDCFTIEKDRVYFWFNTVDESTHLAVSSNSSGTQIECCV